MRGLVGEGKGPGRGKVLVRGWCWLGDGGG